MGLADALGAAAGKDGPPPKKMPMAVSITAEPLDTKHAAANVLKAVEAKDVNGLEDALRMFFAACDEDEDTGDDSGKASKGDEADDYGS